MMHLYPHPNPMNIAARCRPCCNAWVGSSLELVALARWHAGRDMTRRGRSARRWLRQRLPAGAGRRASHARGRGAPAAHPSGLPRAPARRSPRCRRRAGRGAPRAGGRAGRRRPGGTCRAAQAPSPCTLFSLNLIPAPCACHPLHSVALAESTSKVRRGGAHQATAGRHTAPAWTRHGAGT